MVPAVTLLLTLPLAEALQRANRRSKADRIEREHHDFHARVADAFGGATNKSWQADHPECGDIVEINAAGSADEVTERCVSFLANRWPTHLGALLKHSARTSAAGVESGVQS